MERGGGKTARGALAPRAAIGPATRTYGSTFSTVMPNDADAPSAPSTR